MEKLTLEWCFKYYNARIIIADTTTFANVRCMGIPNSPQALDALEKYGQLQLRPLSSLTDEEKEELRTLANLYENGDVEYLLEGGYLALTLKNCSDISNYLYGLNIDFETPSLQERGIAVYE